MWLSLSGIITSVIIIVMMSARVSSEFRTGAKWRISFGKRERPCGKPSLHGDYLNVDLQPANSILFEASILREPGSATRIRFEAGI